MRAVIASHRFNPGHLSHLIANYRLFEELGYEPVFYWAQKYSAVATDAFRTTDFRGLLALEANDVYVLWFPSLIALRDLVLLRTLTAASAVYVLHEPYTTLKSYLAAGFSWKHALRIWIVGQVNNALVKLAHGIILPSRRAFDAAKPSLGDKSSLYLPLLFEDESGGKFATLSQRPFVSYIGTIAADHAFDEFVRFASWSAKHQPGRHRFMIATRSAVPAEYQLQLNELVSSGAMQLHCGRPLSNPEINDFFAKSRAVWNAYRRSMQSGVLAKCYMFGTPVLASRATASEFFVEGVTGISVDEDCSNLSIHAAIERIEADFASFSNECRRKFIELFNYKVRAAVFLEFCRSLQGKNE